MSSSDETMVFSTEVESGSAPPDETAELDVAQRAEEAPASECTMPPSDAQDGSVSPAALRPPYDETCNITEGVKCYLCPKYTAYRWGRLLEHLRLRHGMSHSSFSGTYLHKRGREDLSAHDREKYNARPKMPACVAAAAQRVAGLLSSSSGDVPHRAPHNDNGSNWKHIACWVKCSADGEPLTPLQCRLQRPQEALIKGGCNAVTESQDIPPGAAIHQHNGGWTSELPTVRVRQTYAECRAPTPSAHGGRTKSWPISVGAIDVSPFEQYLVSAKNLHGEWKDAHVRSITRLLDMIECAPRSPHSEPISLLDPSVVVAIYFEGLHQTLFNMDLLDPKHTWTHKILESFKLFCEFQIGVLGRHLLINDDNTILKHKAAIEELLVELRGGFTKRIATARARREVGRRDADRTKIESFPPIDAMQHAVWRGMVTLKHIAQSHGAAGELPDAVQAAATSAMVGIIALNGFMGRKKEWQVATSEHVRHQLDSGLDYIVVTDYKTSQVYGSKGKWLAPGTVSAAKCYLGLPRRVGVTTFLCPAHEATNEVDIPSALRSFCSRHLVGPCSAASGWVWPQVNTLRKWYHTTLHSLVTKQDTLHELFTAVDAHSKNVAARHYILNGPSDDAKLAKHLVTAMLTSPVSWPEDEVLAADGEEMEHLRLFCNRGEPAMADGVGQRTAPQTENEDEDADEDLPWFEMAECFGIQKPLVPIGDVDAAAAYGDAAVVSAGALPTVESPLQTPQKKRKHTVAEAGVDAEDLGIPPLLFNLARPGSTPPDEALDAKAEHALLHVELPTAFKQRYYMNNQEIQWAVNADKVYSDIVGGKGGALFFEQLYKWGVYDGRLDEKCSPGGIKSAVKRSRGELVYSPSEGCAASSR